MPLPRQGCLLRAGEGAADRCADVFETSAMAGVDSRFGVCEVEERDPELVEALNHHAFEPDQPGVRGDQPGDLSLQPREGEKNERAASLRDPEREAVCRHHLVAPVWLT